MLFCCGYQHQAGENVEKALISPFPQQRTVVQYRLFVDDEVFCKNLID